MPLVLASLSALSFGVADYLGGIASKRWPPEWVAGTAQAVGLPVLAPLLLVFPGTLSSSLWWGLVAGLAAGLGIMLLYRALATGPMNVAAPTAAVVSTILPVTIGLILGERPAPLALIGIACGIAAVWLVGASAPVDVDRVTPAFRTALVAIGAGIGLGGAAAAFAQTPESAGLWPLATARVVATALMLFVALTRRGTRAVGDRSGLRLSLSTGLVDTVGSVALVLALQRGLLSLVAVIASLYPAGTVFLARFLLREPIARTQAVGLGLAAAAVVLIGLS